MADQIQHTISGGLRWIVMLVAGVSLGIIGFYLLTEHTAHVYGALPYVFLFGCLFMHLFMHGSHSGHGDIQGESGEGHQHAGHERENKQS